MTPMDKPKESMKPLSRRKVKVKPSNYQPSKAEKEQEFDMPGLDEEAARRAFFQPVKWELPEE